MDLKKPISGALSALVLTSAVTPLSLALEYEQSTKPPVAVHGSALETTQPKLAVLYNSQNILTLTEYDAKLALFSGTAAEKAANPAYETLLLQRRLEILRIRPRRFRQEVLGTVVPVEGHVAVGEVVETVVAVKFFCCIP